LEQTIKADDIMGTHGLGQMNEYGERFADLCILEQPVIVGSGGRRLNKEWVSSDTIKRIEKEKNGILNISWTRAAMVKAHARRLHISLQGSKKDRKDWCIKLVLYCTF
jgi:hypothetical protein